MVRRDSHKSISQVIQRLAKPWQGRERSGSGVTQQSTAQAKLGLPEHYQRQGMVKSSLAQAW